MANRLKSLRRIQDVQSKMIALAEMRLLAAETACRTLEADKTRLDGYVADGDRPGPHLLDAALKSIKTVERRFAIASDQRKTQQEQLGALHRRNHALDAATKRATVADRRANEARDLNEILDAWTASKAG